MAEADDPSVRLEPITCFLCLKKDFWRQRVTPDEDDVLPHGLLGGGIHFLPSEWCRDYNDHGDGIYFCSPKHKDFYMRAKYLSWQAVSLLRDFIKEEKL